MIIRFRPRLLLTAATVAMASLVLTTASASAATIMYAGGQSNMETFSNDPAVGWRNATTAKPLDIDGDNVLGTDGYVFAGSSSVEALPTYVASSARSGGHNDNNRGSVDNPLDASGADIGIGWSGNFNSWNFVFQGSALEAETLRLGVLYDSNWSLAHGEQTFTLTQTVGGSDSATTPTLTLAGDGLDVAYFDLTGVQDGDTFALSRTNENIQWAQVGGVTFDTGGGDDGTTVPEPASIAIWSLLGFCLAGYGYRRRRRNS